MSSNEENTAARSDKATIIDGLIPNSCSPLCRKIKKNIPEIMTCSDDNNRDLVKSAAIMPDLQLMAYSMP